MEKDLVVGIVGPCKSGKSVLKRGLEQAGIQARHIAQEHSFTPAMWQKIGKPDILVYLDVSHQETLKRSSMKWTVMEYEIQLTRLAHARRHADLYIDTNPLTIEEVVEKVLNFLAEMEVN